MQRRCVNFDVLREGPLPLEGAQGRRLPPGRNPWNLVCGEVAYVKNCGASSHACQPSSKGGDVKFAEETAEFRMGCADLLDSGARADEQQGDRANIVGEETAKPFDRVGKSCRSQVFHVGQDDHLNLAGAETLDQAGPFLHFIIANARERIAELLEQRRDEGLHRV